MGNCFEPASADDMSLLPGSDIGRESASSDQLRLPSQFQQEEPVPVFYPSPSVGRTASQLTEEEQVKIAKRIGLIQHLPSGMYDTKSSCHKNKECVICMVEFDCSDRVRYLPCMHVYHTLCIDDWLMRSFTCPSCMEPVDAALFSSYENN